MQVKLNKVEKGQIELNIEVSIEELKPFLEKAVKSLSEKVKIKGFRPGHASYDIVKKEMGEMAIYEEAVDRVVSKTYVDAIKENNLETVGQPKIEIVKLAPANSLEYKATVALLPKVTIGDWKKVKVEKKEVKITPDKVDKAVEQLTKMQTKEILVNRPVGEKDKIVVDMNMYLDKVPVDGGQAKDHSIFLTEEYFVPGFKEKVIGQKKGETREFNLDFSKEHYQKNLAGKKVNFKVTVKDVFELQPPKIDDEFAKVLGQKSLGDLRKLMEDNLQKEEGFKEDQRSEGEMLDKLVKESKFEELPQILLESEVEKMILELKENLSKQGMKFEDYVSNILKKKVEDLKKEFLPQAESRVKTALVVREIANQENIKAEEKEIDEEAEKMVSLYTDTPELKDNLNSPGGRGYLANLISNRKVIDLLKKEIIK